MVKDEITKHIDEIAEFLGVRPVDGCTEIKLSDFKEVNSSLAKGVYIAFTDDEIIYVGQGKVRKRLERLTEKLIGGDFSKMRAKDTQGFQWLREHQPTNIVDCHVIYFECEDWADCTAFEGVLIKKLNPLANSETGKDNEEIDSNNQILPD
jgi:hypothetical protein